MRPYQDDIDNISTRWKAAYGIGCMLTYGVFLIFSENGKALVAAGSFASIVLVARVRWNLRRFTWYWLFLAGAAIVHGILIALFNHAVDVHPTIMLAPLGIADYLILLFALYYLEKLVAP